MIKKKSFFTAVLISALIALISINFISSLLFTEGSGTAQNPYQIENCGRLQDIQNSPGSYYVLIRDIDCSDTINWNDGKGFKPVSFSGNFNGSGHVISNMFINWGGQLDFTGLFSQISGKAYDFGMINPDFTNTKTGGRMGGIAGEIIGNGNLQRIYTKGGILKNSGSSPKTGGIAGNARAGLIKDCYVRETSYGWQPNPPPGGISGTMMFSGDITIDKCYSAVNGKGLIGKYEKGIVKNSFWDITIGSQSSPKGTGKTTSELQSIETYTDTNIPGLDESYDIVLKNFIDGETWFVDDGNAYPKLGWEKGIKINLISPTANAGFSISTIQFKAEILDQNFLGIQKVRLLIDGNIDQTSDPIIGDEYLFTKTFPDGQYKWRIQVLDGNNKLWESPEKVFTIVSQDNNPPVYSEASHNSILAGGKTKFSIIWDDELLQSDGYYIFSTDNSGQWVDDPPIKFIDTPNKAETVKTLNDIGNTTIRYKWKAVDNIGNSYETPVFSLTTVSGDPNAVLPQDYDWQVILRNYLSTFDESDFEVNLEYPDYEEFYFSSADEVYHTWVAFMQRLFNFPDLVLYSSEFFLLENIENKNNGKIYMKASGDLSPVSMAFWTDWNYSGNPYYGNENLKRRAFAVSAVDMIMLRNSIDGPYYGSSIYVGGYVLRNAYVYNSVKDILPDDVKWAYEKELKYMVDKIYKKAGEGANSDMNSLSIPAMWYFYNSIDDPVYKQKAIDHAKKVLSPPSQGGSVHPIGIISFAGAPEVSYNGIFLHFLTWGALASEGDENWKFAGEKLSEMTQTRSSLIFSEPLNPPKGNSHGWGASHFNARQPGDSKHDQWQFANIRNIGAFMNSYDLGTLSGVEQIFAFANPNNWVGEGIVSESKMRSDNKANIARMKTQNEVKIKTTAPEIWVPDHWIRENFYITLHKPNGIYDFLENLQDTNSEYTKLATDRPDNFIKKFPESDEGLPKYEKNVFLLAKFDNYSALFYTGRIGFFPGMNIAGGGLSVFHTKDGGIAILGRTKGYDNGDQEWKDLEEWPIHAVSGRDENGKGFSSARLDTPYMYYLDYNINGNENAAVNLSGPIGIGGDGRTMESNSLSGKVDYSREFYTYKKGVIIETKIESDGTDEVSALYETIPVFLGTSSDHLLKANAKIFFKYAGNYIEAENQWIDNIEKIKIERFGKPVYITFDSPRKAKLSDNIWGLPNTNDLGAARNIMIDMLGNNSLMPAQTRVKYIISPDENSAPIIPVEIFPANVTEPIEIYPVNFTKPIEIFPANITPKVNATKPAGRPAVNATNASLTPSESVFASPSGIGELAEADSKITGQQILENEAYSEAVLGRGVECYPGESRRNYYCNAFGEWNKKLKSKEFCIEDAQCSGKCNDEGICERPGFFEWIAGFFG